MNTTYDEIIDLALISIEDYRLNNLFKSSPEKFKLVLEGFLVRGIPSFDNCIKDLSDRDDTTKSFNFTLDDMEKSILADYTVLAWLDKQINDVRQITAMLQNKQEAHRYSEANLLNAKRERRIQIAEDVAQKKTRYGLKNTPWKDWANGKYEL